MESVLGAAVLAVAMLFAADALGARRGRRLFRTPPLTLAARRGLMVLSAIAASVMILPSLVPGLRRGFFAFCAVCPLSPATFTGLSAPEGFSRPFLLGLWYYAATVLPVFVLACLLSGLVLARTRRLPVRGPVTAFALAAALPVCSCGAIPLGRAIIDRGGRPSDGIIFIAAAPLLSPIILFLAITILGMEYTIARILGAAAIAAAAGAIAAQVVDPSRAGRPAVASSPFPSVAPGGSVLLAGWRYLTVLIRYVLYGVVLGALFTALVPADYVAALIRTGPLSLAAAVVVGVPVNMCAGEEIILSAPLVGMGLTMGHAVAFGLASTGICLASIPLLTAALGRRATVALVAIYLVVPFLIGIVVNLLPLATTLGPEPF
jgi:uncharacterized membrane protein YraQ (UPF0718 family)